MKARYVKGGVISGFTVGKNVDNKLLISHLLFVDDDTIIFCNPYQVQLRYLSASLFQSNDQIETVFGKE